MNKVKVKVIHIVELYKQREDGRQVYQIKLQVQVTPDAIGETKGKYYYYKVLEPKVKVGDVVEINLDDYDTYKEEFTPKDSDEVILLTYLKRKV